MFVFEGSHTRREQRRMTEEALDSCVAPYCGDIYYTSLDLFPGFSLLRTVLFRVQEDFRGITSAVFDNGEAGIWVSQHKNFVTDSMKTRVVERFHLPSSWLSAPDSALLPFMFAHELGHIAQAEPVFQKYFGPFYDEWVDSKKDYAGYVNSDEEVNADYLAAVIVGNSQFGRETNFMPPKEPPSEWREWGKVHGVPITIRLNQQKD